MDVVSKAFHELILQANRAHFAYNQHGPEAGAYALRCLVEQAAALDQHLRFSKKEE